MRRYDHAVTEKRVLRLAVLLLTSAVAVVLLSQKVFARTTYQITDGSRVLVHTTTAKRTETVLDEVGLLLDTDDTYTARQQSEGTDIRITRGKRVTVDYHGERMEVISPGEPVWQLLERLNLSWAESDVISAPLDAQVYDGMVLTVALVTYEIQSYTALLPYQTVRCYDPSLPKGREILLRPGKNGLMQCAASVTMVNGLETERRVLSEYVTVQPVEAVVAVGTGQAMKSGEDKRMPIIGDGIITLPTGEVVRYTERITSLATAYCDKGLTATGTQARVGAIAVDPDYIPYGTRMFIMTLDGEYVYGIATAEDCGSKEYIHDTRIDLHYDTYAECRQFGARWCHVYILG